MAPGRTGNNGNTAAPVIVLCLQLKRIRKYISYMTLLKYQHCVTHYFCASQHHYLCIS